MFRFIILYVLFSITIFAKNFNILLLKNFDYSLVNDKNIHEYLVSEKLDGVRAVWNGKEFESKNGKIISVPKCFTQGYPSFYLDGELWSKRGDFEYISSVTKSKNTTCDRWKGIQYYVFDVPFGDELIQNSVTKSSKNLDSLESRLQILKNYLTNYSQNKITIRIIKQEKIDSIKSLNYKLDKITKAGGEGLVVRKNIAPYNSHFSNVKASQKSIDVEFTRNIAAFKLKKFQDSECKVKSYTQGKGKFQGKIGAIICTQALQSFSPINHPLMNANNKNEEIEFKIGSGFSIRERENPPKIGTLITYKFQGFNKKGLPRFPVFLRIYEP